MIAKTQFVHLISATAFSFFTGITSPSWAQSGIPQEDSNKAISDTGIYRAITHKSLPDYNWNIYLSESLIFPKQFLRDRVSVKIIIEMVIEKDGSISNPRALRKEGQINNKQATAEELQPFIEEALRVLSIAPKWQPGRYMDTVVRSYFTIPIVFRTQ